jgi:hypothetical protein
VWRADALPEPSGTDLTALLDCPQVATWWAIAQALAHASHDQLPRMLRGRWSGQPLLDVARRALFTVVEKPSAALLEEAAWVWSTKHHQVGFGIPRVLVVWTNGQVPIPLALRLWTKGGASKFDLALEWLSYARHPLKVNPRFGLFDAW